MLKFIKNLKNSKGGVSSKKAVKTKPEGVESSIDKTNTRGLDFLISASLFLIFLICPLFFTGFVARGMGFEKVVVFYFLVLLGTVSWVTKGVVTGEFKFKRTPLDFPLLGILIVFIISTITSVNQKASLIGSYGSSVKSLVSVIVFILFFYLLINNVDAKKIKFLFWTFLTSTFLMILYTTLQLFDVFLLPIEFTKNNNFNPIGSLTSFSMYLIIILPILVIITAQAKEIIKKASDTNSLILKVITGISLLLSFIILVFLNGVTYWIAAIAGIVVLLLFLISKIVNISNNNLIIPVTAFFLLIIFLILGNFNFMNFQVQPEINISRDFSWEIAKNSIKDSPILGSGPSTFYYSFTKFRGLDINNTEFWNVRFNSSSGFIFELLSTVGIAGALLAVIFILIALYVMYKSISNPRETDTQNILLALFSSFIVILILSSMFALSNTLILISILILILALTVALTTYPKKLNTLSLSLHISSKYNMVLAVIFLAISAGVITMFTLGAKLYLADVYARQSFEVEALDERIIKLEKATQLAPYEDVYYLNLANYYISLANQEASGNQDQNIILKNLNQAIKYARFATETAPEKAANHELLALIYENASIYTNGGIIVWAKSLEDSYNKVIELEPNNPVPYFRIALLNIARANAETEDNEQKQKYFNEAIGKYDLAIQRKADLSAAYYGKGIAYEKLQNINEAIEQLKAAVNTADNNIDYAFELGRLYFNRGVAQAVTEDVEVRDTIEVPTEPEEGEEPGVETKTITSSKTVTKRNDDIDIANQIFLNIVQVVNDHANALYSLALLYQTIDEADNAKVVVTQLLNILPDGEQKDLVQEQFKGLY